MQVIVKKLKCQRDSCLSSLRSRESLSNTQITLSQHLIDRAVIDDNINNLTSIKDNQDSQNQWIFFSSKKYPIKVSHKKNWMNAKI